MLAIGAIGGQRAEVDQGSGGVGVAACGLDDLEHRAAAIRPAYVCSAEQVAMRISDQAGCRTSAIVCRAEASQNCGCAGIAAGDLGEFEHRADGEASLVNCKSPSRRAEQVAIGVKDQATARTRSIGAIGQGAEADEGRGGAGIAVIGLLDLKHRPAETNKIARDAAMCPAAGGRAEQVAFGIGDQAAARTCAIGAS